MQDQIFQRQTIVKAPIEKVFEFFSDAKNLEVLTPEFLQFKILDQSTPKIQKGTVFTYKLKIHGIPVVWKSLIEEWVPNSHFSDVQLKGPYQKWHHVHKFKSVSEGTIVEDVVNYRLRFGFLTQPIVGNWVRKDVENIFTFRESKIKALF